MQYKVNNSKKKRLDQAFVDDNLEYFLSLNVSESDLNERYHFNERYKSHMEQLAFNRLSFNILNYLSKNSPELLTYPDNIFNKDYSNGYMFTGTITFERKNPLDYVNSISEHVFFNYLKERGPISIIDLLIKEIFKENSNETYKKIIKIIDYIRDENLASSYQVLPKLYERADLLKREIKLSEFLE